MGVIHNYHPLLSDKFSSITGPGWCHPDTEQFFPPLSLSPRLRWRYYRSAHGMPVFRPNLFIVISFQRFGTVVG